MKDGQAVGAVVVRWRGRAEMVDRELLDGQHQIRIAVRRPGHHNLRAGLWLHAKGEYFPYNTRCAFYGLTAR